MIAESGDLEFFLKSLYEKDYRKRRQWLWRLSRDVVGYEDYTRILQKPLRIRKWNGWKTQRREGEGVILNRKICLLERRCRKHAQLGYNIGMHAFCVLRIWYGGRHVREVGRHQTNLLVMARKGRNTRDGIWERHALSMMRKAGMHAWEVMGERKVWEHWDRKRNAKDKTVFLLMIWCRRQARMGLKWEEGILGLCWVVTVSMLEV
jgi:hypothetical protein